MENTKESARSGDRMWGPLSSWWPCGVLCLWGLVLRVLAVGKVFPAPADVSHFVQYGKEYAVTGTLGSLSALWSLGPQLLSAWCMKLGWMPQSVLQWLSVVFGLLSVAGVYALARELTGGRRVAVLAGLFVATNPILTELAATGYAETAHYALGAWTLAFGFAGARRRNAWLFALAAVTASLDLFFRSFDLFLWLGAAAPFVLWRLRGCGWLQGVRLVGTAVAVGAVCSLPFFVVTKAVSGWNPGHSKLSNLAIGESGTNAKDLYAVEGVDGEQTPFVLRVKELERDGVAKYLWTHKAEIARRYPGNIATGLRVLNAHAFAGMFRLGLFWFLLAGMLCTAGMRGWTGWYMWLSVAAVLGAISLGFINTRWVVQCVPFVAILAGGGFAWLLSRFPDRRLHALLWGVLLAAGFLNGWWAVARLDDKWKQRNVYTVCERLHRWMGEGERIMCFTPELPALFYTTNALNWLVIPYDTVERVFAQADARSADCIVLDDSMLAHFPIHEIERHPELVPAPWKEVDNLEFEKETRFELERNVWRVYRREGWENP